MNSKFLFLIAISIIGFAILLVSATANNTRVVLTVVELLGEGDGNFSRKASEKVRLGARVAGREIVYKTEPTFNLNFWVVDIPDEGSADSEKVYPTSQKLRGSNSKVLQVSYPGIKPDTLQVGRDVILEGTWDGNIFQASSLLTQCPSKYEPPEAP